MALLCRIENFPVIRINFSNDAITNRSELVRRIGGILRLNFQDLDLSCPDLPGSTVRGSFL